MDKIIYARGALRRRASKAWRTYESQLSDLYATPITTWQAYNEWVEREFSEHIGPEKRWDKFANLWQGQN